MRTNVVLWVTAAWRWAATFHPWVSVSMTALTGCQVSTGFFVQAKEFNWFLFCRPYSPCYNCPVLLSQGEINYWWSVNEWIWLCSNKALFIKICGRQTGRLEFGLMAIVYQLWTRWLLRSLKVWNTEVPTFPGPFHRLLLWSLSVVWELSGSFS